LKLQQLIVFDSTAMPAGLSGEIYCWNGYAENESVHSLLRYVDENGARFRKRYVNFIHDLGQTVIQGKRIVEYLEVEKNFSLWWMSRLAEMSTFNSPRILDCLRVLALEEILTERNPTRVLLISSDANVAETIRGLCAQLKIEFAWRTEKRKSTVSFHRRLYDRLPQFIQAPIYLARHVVMRWSLRNVGPITWFHGRQTVFFLSNFFHLDRKLAEQGRFYPRQWEALPDFLHGQGIWTNFVHRFVFSPDIPNARVARTWAHRFNFDGARQGAHAFLDTFLTVGVVLRVFFKWLLLLRAIPALRAARKNFTPEDSKASLWPLLRDEWHASISGNVAMMNLIWVELFDVAMKSVPPQEIGLYLCENQAWERAFINAWRMHGHGELVAVPHSTVRFWDIRYFNDPRELESTKPLKMPIPDKIAVNGKMAWHAFVEAGYPVSGLAEVEALRYQYLYPYVANSRSNSGRSLTLCSKSTEPPRKILILGDYSNDQTTKMLSCAEAAMSLINKGMSFTLKPHPVCDVATEAFPNLHLESTVRPLVEIIDQFDLAFASNTTSAGLDAHLAGLPVVVFLDDSGLNCSPLRSAAGVRFVSSPAELANALQIAYCEDDAPGGDDFFWLDPQMPKWRRLLSSAGVTC
jgi:surface carbohydrate biosynthesis protein (TIGR04326 family)